MLKYNTNEKTTANLGESFSESHYIRSIHWVKQLNNPKNIELLKKLKMCVFRLRVLSAEEECREGTISVISYTTVQISTMKWEDIERQKANRKTSHRTDAVEYGHRALAAFLNRTLKFGCSKI